MRKWFNVPNFLIGFIIVIWAYLFLSLIGVLSHADTPPPNTVKAKMFSGDGTQAITATGGKLDVNFAGSITGTVDQGAAGVQPWLVNVNSPITISGLTNVNVLNFPTNQTVNGTVDAVQSGGWSVDVGNFPGVQAVSQSGAWSTAITNFPSLTNTNVLNFPATQSVTQGGAWLTNINNFPSAFGRNWALSSGTDSVTITGSITATNSANGATGAPVPAEATQMAGKDSLGNLNALKVSASGVLSVDGSSFTQPVSGSVSVSNFPGVQAVSQSGTWTVEQGSPPWSSNLTQLSGATPSATNYLPSRITNGAAFVDPTQIRALSSGTDSVNVGNFPATQAVTQSGSWLTNINNFPTTQAVTGNLGRTWNLTNVNDSVNVGNFPASQTIAGTVTANQGGIWNLTNISGVISLPTGAATSANQTTANSSLSSIDGKIPSGLTVTSTRLLVDGSGVTQPISAVSLPLPTGAATAANQTTANASLSSIDTKLTAPLSVAQSGVWNIANLTNITGSISLPAGASTSALQTSGNASLTSIDSKLTAPLSVAQSGVWNISNINGVVSLPTGAATAANQTTGNSSLSSIDSKLTNLNSGAQKTQVVDGAGAVQGPVQTISGTNYMPVVLAASATSGAALVARSIQVAGSDGVNAQTLSTDTSGRLNLGNINGVVSLPTGASTAANQVLSNNYLSNIDAKTPALGQAAMVASRPVVIASDQSLSTGSFRQQLGNISAQCTTPTSCAAGTTVTISTAGAQTVISQITGTFSATMTYEISNDGTNWSVLQAFDPLTNSLASTITAATKVVNLPAVGAQLRIRCTAYTSGTPVVTLIASTSMSSATFAAQAGSWNVQGTNAENGSISGVFPLIVGGQYVTSLPSLTTNNSASNFHMDSSGRLLVGVNGLTGTVNSGATDAGSPIKVGGVYNTTPITLTNGQRGDAQMNARGAVKVEQDGDDSVQLVRNDYTSTNVTTGAYVQLIASTSDVIETMFIFDSSGQTLFFAVGAAASEVNKFYIVPGGNGWVPLEIPAGSRISVKAVSATASAGELNIAFFK